MIYSVDALLLSPDFTYAPVEGSGPLPASRL